MDIKRWIEEKTELKAKETGYIKTEPLPYLIYDDDTARRGADDWICITEHTTTFYFCSQERDRAAEQRIEAAMESEAWEYSKEVEYDRNDKLFITTYYFEWLEKEIGHGEE